MAEIQVKKTDVTLNIGENGAADRANVSIRLRTGPQSSGFSLTVDLPPGTIVSDPLSAEKQARHAAADILDKVVSSLQAA